MKIVFQMLYYPDLKYAPILILTAADRHSLALNSSATPFMQ